MFFFFFFFFSCAKNPLEVGHGSKVPEDLKDRHSEARLGGRERRGLALPASQVRGRNQQPKDFDLVRNICFPFGFERNLSLLDMFCYFFPGVLTKWKSSAGEKSAAQRGRLKSDLPGKM